MLEIGNGGMACNCPQGSRELLKCQSSTHWFTPSNLGALLLSWSGPLCRLDGWVLGIGRVVVFLCLSSKLFFEVSVLTVWPLLSRCRLEACCVLLSLGVVTVEPAREAGLESSVLFSACLWAFLPLLATALILEAVPGGRVAVKLILFVEEKLKLRGTVGFKDLLEPDADRDLAGGNFTDMIAMSEFVFSISAVVSLSGSLLSLAEVISASGCVVTVCGSWLVSMVPSEVGGCLPRSENGGACSWVVSQSAVESALHDRLVSGSTSGWMTTIRGSRGSKERRLLCWVVFSDVLSGCKQE